MVKISMKDLGNPHQNSYFLRRKNKIIEKMKMQADRRHKILIIFFTFISLEKKKCFYHVLSIG